MAKVGALSQMGAKSSPKIAKGSPKGAMPPKGMGMGTGMGSPKGMGANPAGARRKPVFKYGGAVMKLASGGSVSSKGVTNPWMQNWDTGESRAGGRGDGRSEGRNQSRMGGRPDIRENRAGGRSGGRGAVKPMPMDDDDGDNDMKRGGAVKKKMASGGKVKLAAGGKVPGYALGDLVDREMPARTMDRDLMERRFLEQRLRELGGDRMAMPGALSDRDARMLEAASSAGLGSMPGPLSERDLRASRALTPTEASIGAESDPMIGAFAKGGRVKGAGAKVPKAGIKGANMKRRSTGGVVVPPFASPDELRANARQNAGMMARGRGYSSGGEVMLSSGKTVGSSFSKLCSDGAKMGFKNTKGR